MERAVRLRSFRNAVWTMEVTGEWLNYHFWVYLSFNSSLDYNFLDNLSPSVNNPACTPFCLLYSRQTVTPAGFRLRSLSVCTSVESHHECGHGTQRGEPQHPSDEQQRNVAILHPGHRSPARHLAQHSLRQRARGLDPHQPHTQSGEWSRRPVDTASTTSFL